MQDAHKSGALYQWGYKNPIKGLVLFKYNPSRAKKVPEGVLENFSGYLETDVCTEALGRKNYLFTGSHNTAQNIAMMYSFFASCKVNNIEPMEWLTDVLENILEHKANKLHELLPHNYNA